MSELKLKYAYIRDGIPVTEKKPNGQTEEKRAMIIDFQHSDDMERNHFLAVKEMKIHGDLYRRRTDIVGFVNGIPLLFVELKKNSVDVQNAYTDNYTDYLDTIPQLFYYNAFLMLSNGVEAKVGTLGSKYEFFHEWKRLSEQEQGSVALETMLRGICKKENFLDLLENFILYDHSGGKTVKILARNHQYLGVNEAVKAYEARKLNNGKLGVFWHTQGSGKSYSMVFLSQKIRRKFAGSPTIVVLTDREELNSQISDTFENCGLLGKTKASKFIATSGEDLISKLKGNPSFIFTLIQKFNKKVDEPIIPDHDIIIMSDEAHRSQYGVFADNMVGLLPTASRIGFTGTPLDSLGLPYNNGFTGTYKRKFNPASYKYAYVEDMNLSKEVWERVPNSFNLYKIHGSISWYKDEGDIFEKDYADIGSEDTVMIYPTPLKDRTTLMVPYSDLFRNFESSLLKQNSVLVTLGYSFADDHINRLILNALAIPTFKLIVFGESDAITKLIELDDKRIIVINSDDKIHYFKNFVEKIMPEQSENSREMIDMPTVARIIKSFEEKK